MTVGQFYNKEDKIMAFKKVVVVGGGVLGSQIAYQVAYKGFDVTVWLRSEEMCIRDRQSCGKRV